LKEDGITSEWAAYRFKEGTTDSSLKQKILGLGVAQKGRGRNCWGFRLSWRQLSR